MKKRLFYLFIVVSIFIFNSCSPETATITGTLQECDSTLVLFGNQILNENLDTIQILNGKFSEKIELENPGYYTLVVGNEFKQIFLASDYELNINASKVDNKIQIDYTGKGEIENKMLEKILTKIDNIDYNYLQNIETENITTYIDSIFTDFSSSFAKMIKGKNLDPNFVNFQGKYCKYKAATLKLILGLQHNITDSTYYQFVDDLELNNAQYLGIPDYRWFLQYYTEKLLSDQLSKLRDSESSKPEIWINEEFKVIETFENAKIKEYLYFTTIKQIVENEGLEGFELCRETYDKQLKHDKYRNIIKALLNKKMQLAKGKPVPDYIGYDINDKEVHLSDFKGKVIYLDFWATWCGPCKAELPYYMKLSQQYQNKGIVFISISIDNPDKIEDWKNMIKNEHSIVQLRTHIGWDPQLIDKFQVNSVPTYFLIDAEGKIIDATAPRPSSAEIKPLLDQLIK